MSKYDFGYELIPGSTTEWAFNEVKERTTILELGPANGNLTYHLYTEKKCKVDIIEIDEESGKKAAKYARKACLGKKKGNLELDYWFKKLKNNRYDYIIILDVFEHIRNAQDILNKLKTLLIEGGTILLSIPNVAHNSVILNLLRNRFRYTDVGLLDDTHVHFYTYESIKSMIQSCQLYTSREQVIQNDVGTNEIESFYGELPRAVEAFLKSRFMGTAYQFLFSIKKEEVKKVVELEYDSSFDKKYEVVVFNQNNDVIYQEKVNPIKSIVLEMEAPQNGENLRLDPLNTNCVIRNLQILFDDRDSLDCINAFTGTKLDNLYIFYDDDPRIYISILSGVKRIQISYEILNFESNILENIQGLRDYIRALEQDAVYYRSEIEQLERQLKDSKNNNTQM